MEFVHRHEAHIGMGAFAQSLIGEDFGGAADDRRVRVDVAVTGDHADIVAAEHFDQVEEFLRHQRLDRSGVIERRPVHRAAKCMPSATSDLPEPVGVFKITWSPAKRSIMASS